MPAQKLKHDCCYISKSKYAVSFLQLSKDSTFQYYGRYCLGRNYSFGEIVFADTAMVLQAHKISDSALIYAIQPHRERFPTTGCFYNEEGQLDTAHFICLPGSYNQDFCFSVTLRAGTAVVNSASAYRRVSYARYARFVQWFFRT